MKRISLALAIALRLSAQTTIDVGKTGDGCGGSIWNPTQSGYVFLGAAPWEDLRFSVGTTPFSCSYPMPDGFYNVELGLMEPNKTGAGQRLFTVTANGSTSEAIDLFKLVGLRQQYVLKMVAAVNNGVLRFDFRSTLGNAVVSSITITPATAATVPLGSVQATRGAYTGAMIPVIGADGKLRTAIMLNGSVSMQLPGEPDVIAFGFPALRLGVKLTPSEGGRWLFPAERPNPENSVAVAWNGLNLDSSEWHFAPFTPPELPSALILNRQAMPGDTVTVTYVVGGVPVQ